MVVESNGVVKDGPFASGIPPVGFAYQSIVVPVPSEAERFTVPLPQLEPFVTVGAEGAGVILTTALPFILLLHVRAVATTV